MTWFDEDKWREEQLVRAWQRKSLEDHSEASSRRNQAALVAVAVTFAAIATLMVAIFS